MQWIEEQESMPDLPARTEQRMAAAGDVCWMVAGGIAEADDPAVLGAIGLPGVVLAVWRRSVPGLRQALEAVPFDRFPSARIESCPSEVGVRLRETVDLASSDRDWVEPLVADVEALSSMFAAVMATSRVRVRLDPVDRDMCRYFHRDNVDARLITTYFGATTQFLEPKDCDPRGLGTGDNDRIVRSWHSVRSMPLDGVGLFGGSRHPQAGSGCVHRSPPMDRDGGRRLLLCIDTARPAT